MVRGICELLWLKIILEDLNTWILLSSGNLEILLINIIIILRSSSRVAFKSGSFGEPSIKSKGRRLLASVELGSAPVGKSNLATLTTLIDPPDTT